MSKKIRVAPTPPYCSSCFSQKGQLVHVDFGAAWDGPVLDPGNGMKQAIDDLVICSDCIGEAARLIGYLPASADNPSGLIEKLERDLASERGRTLELSRRLQNISEAIDLADPLLSQRREQRKAKATARGPKAS